MRITKELKTFNFFNCFLLIVAIVLIAINCHSTTYIKPMQVISIDDEQITLKDLLTNQYFIIQEKNKRINDYCNVTFNDNNTEDVNDDTIIKIEWSK